MIDPPNGYKLVPVNHHVPIGVHLFWDSFDKTWKEFHNPYASAMASHTCPVCTKINPKEMEW